MTLKEREFSLFNLRFRCRSCVAEDGESNVIRYGDRIEVY